MGELRRFPRVKISAPVACSFVRLGLERWSSLERSGYGVVLDISLSGARVMSPVQMSPGDKLAVSWRFPDQPQPMQVDATVRWGRQHSFGLQFSDLPHMTTTRLQKFLANALA